VAEVMNGPFTVTETIREGTAWLDEPPMIDQPGRAGPSPMEASPLPRTRRLDV